MRNPRAHVQHYTPPAVTPTRRGLWHCVRRAGRIAWISFLIWECEAYLQSCAHDHIIAGDDMLGFRLELQALRVSLALAQRS